MDEKEIMRGSMKDTKDVVAEFIKSKISGQKRNYIKEFQSYIDMLSQGKASRIAVFGAGEAGKKLFTELQKRLIKVDFFCDNDVNKQGYVFQDSYCISLEELKLVKNSTLVIIVSPNFSKEIEKQLRDLQFPYMIHVTQIEPFMSTVEPVWGIDKIDKLKEMNYSSEEVRYLIEEFQLTLYETCRYYEELIQSLKEK